MTFITNTGGWLDLVKGVIDLFILDIEITGRAADYSRSFFIS